MNTKSRRFICIILTAAMAAGFMQAAVFAQAEDYDNYGSFDEMLDDAREEFFETTADEAENLEVADIDMSGIIHVPQEYIEPGPPPLFAPSAAQLMDYSGPFALGDTRDFSAEGRIIKGELRGQSENVNVWVLDCTDYHAKTGRAHNTNCHLNDINTTVAQSIADDCDIIYERMTEDFGAHANVQIRPGYSNCPVVGDLGNDGKVNFLLYDIDGDGGASSYVAGFFTSGDFFTTTGYNALDMLHIDIGEGQGYNAFKPGATQEDKLRVYGTLAHEFQHLLFFMYFGLYEPSSVRAYTWFNEALSELAGTYYVQEGIEVADFSRLSRAAVNSYSNGSGYGDLLNFNNSLKNYGMGKLFSMLFYKRRGSSFVQDIYSKMIAELPPAQNYSQTSANETKITNLGHDAMVGSLLYPAAGLGSNSTEAFQLAYYLFMENFASDGGMICGDAPVQSTKFYTATNPVDNLWAIRPVAGLSNGRIFLVPGGSGSAYSGSNYDSIPTYTSGSAITLSGYGTSGGKQASHEMLYKLSSGSTSMPVLRITAPSDGNTATRYYAVVPGDQLTTSGSIVYSNGSSGADVYPLRKGIEEYIDTNGKPAYLFVSTLNKNVSSSAAYTWVSEMPEPEPEPEPFTGMYGDVNGDARVNGTDVQTLVLWISSGRPEGQIDEAAARVSGFGGRPDASDVQALVVWINNGGKANEGHPGPG